MALICGDFDMLHAKGSTMAYGRYYLGNAAFVFFNKSAEKKIIKVKIPDAFKAATMKRNFGAKWQLKAGYLEVELLPYSFEILCTESL
jgi:hypothetical protein